MMVAVVACMDSVTRMRATILLLEVVLCWSLNFEFDARENNLNFKFDINLLADLSSSITSPADIHLHGSITETEKTIVTSIPQLSIKQYDILNAFPLEFSCTGAELSIVLNRDLASSISVTTGIFSVILSDNIDEIDLKEYVMTTTAFAVLNILRIREPFLLRWTEDSLTSVPLGTLSPLRALFNTSFDLSLPVDAPPSLTQIITFHSPLKFNFYEPSVLIPELFESHCRTAYLHLSSVQLVYQRVIIGYRIRDSSSLTCTFAPYRLKQDLQLSLGTDLILSCDEMFASINPLESISLNKFVSRINNAVQVLSSHEQEGCLPFRQYETILPIKSPPPSLSPSSQECNGLIECALNDIVIGPIVLDICMDASDVNICFLDLTCRDMNLASFSSHLVSPYSFFLALDKISFRCEARWNATSQSNITGEAYSGVVQLSVSSLSTSSDILISPSPAGGGDSVYPPLPQTLAFTGCTASEAVVSVDFGQDPVGVMLNRLVSPVVEEVLSNSFEWIICDLAEPVLARAITRYISDVVDPLLKSVIALAPPPPPVIMPDCIEWNNTFVAPLHRIAQVIRGDEILRCMLVGDMSKHLIAHFRNILISPDSDRMLFSLPLSLSTSLSLASGVEISINQVEIVGLRSLSGVDLLKPSIDSNVTLRSQIGFEDITIQIQLTITSVDNSYEETGLLTLQLGNVSAILDLVLALQEESLYSLYADQVLSIACLINSLEEMYLSSLELQVTVLDFSYRQLRGDATELERDTVQLINVLSEVLLGGYGEMVSSIIAGIAQGPLKQFINAGIESFVVDLRSTLEGQCSPHGSYSEVDYVEWSSSPLIETIDIILNEMLGPDGMNQLAQCLFPGGDANFFLPSDSSLPNWGVAVEGLSSFYVFEMLYPDTSLLYGLDNQIGVGSCPALSKHSSAVAVCSPLEISLFSPTGDHSIHLTMENLYLFLALEIQLDRSALLNLQLGQFHTPGCILTTVSDLALTAFNVSVGHALLIFKNASHDFDATHILSVLLNQLTSQSNIDAINDRLKQALASSGDKCSGSITPSAEDDDTAPSRLNTDLEISIIVSCGVVAIGLITLFLFVRNHLKDKARLSRMSDPEPSTIIIGSQIWFDKLWRRVLQRPHDETLSFDALIASDKLSLPVRVLVLLAILLNIALFVWSDVSTIANMMCTIHIRERVLDLGSVFFFTLGDTVKDMWDAKTYALAVLVAFFSGAWPFVKLVTMFVSFTFPMSALSLAWRDSLLTWMDILGKWSLLDTYIMVMLMVAFEFDLFISSGIRIQVYVKPEWGFYSFLLATMLSLCLGHISLYLHREVCETKIPDTEESDTEAVMNHTFQVQIYCERPEEGEEGEEENRRKSLDEIDNLNEVKPIRRLSGCWFTRPLELTPLGKVLFALLLLMTIGTVLIGSSKETFNFEFRGLTGYLLGDNAIATYSMVSLGTALPSASGSPLDPGVRWIQASYFIYGLAMPVLFVVMVLVLWVFPLSLRTQKRVIVLTEIIYAWSAADVFVVAVVVAAFEIQQFAIFLIGDHCDGLNQFLREYMDEALDGDDVCFDVIATLKKNTWLLYFSSSVLAIVGVIAMGMCRAAFAQRLDEAKSDGPIMPFWRSSSSSSRQRSTSMSSLIDANSPLLAPHSYGHTKDGLNDRELSVASVEDPSHNEPTIYRRVVSETMIIFLKLGLVKFCDDGIYL